MLKQDKNERYEGENILYVEETKNEINQSIKSINLSEKSSYEISIIFRTT